MSTTAIPNFPRLSDKETAKEAIQLLDGAEPWNTTFLLHELRIWSDSWLRPYLNDIANRA